MYPSTSSWRFVVLAVMAAAALVAPVQGSATALGTGFTYQGTLADGSGPANGTYDLRFFLYNADAGGSQVGPTVLVENLVVADGRLVATLDFGPVFTGDALWLEVGVRDGVSTGAYTTLSPRQPLTATPYARHAATADTATTATTATTANNATQLNGQAPSYYLAWDNLTEVPTGLDDGDDDTLGELPCGDGEIVRWSGGVWTCGADAGALASTYLVGPVGAAAANGAALLAAVAALPTVTESTPVLVKLEPGVYDLGASRLLLPTWVDLEGSGQECTTITSAVCGTTSFATLFISGYSEASRVSVENTCAGADFGIGILQGHGARLTEVTATSAGDALNSYAIRVFGSSAVMRDVTAVVLDGSGTGQRLGVSITQPGLEVRGLQVSVTGGTVTAKGIWGFASGRLTMRDTTVTVEATSSDVMGLHLQNSDSVEVTRLKVSASSSSGVGTGATLSMDDGSDLRFSDVVVRAAGSSWAYGLIVSGGATTALEQIDVEAEAPFTRALTVRNYSTVDTEARLAGARVSCDDIALQVERGDTGAVTVLVSGSVIRGLSNTVSGVAGTETVRVGGSQLYGGAVNNVVVSCAAVWDESHTFHSNTCP